MNIILNDGTHQIDLPAGLQWTDEFAWSPLGRLIGWSVSGALVIETETNPRQSGRPVTLSGGTNYAWVQRNDLLTLQAWREAGTTFSMTLADSRVMQAIFRDEDDAIQARPVRFPAPSIIPATEPYQLTLKFMEVPSP